MGKATTCRFQAPPTPSLTHTPHPHDPPPLSTPHSIRPALVPGPTPASPPVLAHLLPLCWGADHRVLDGASLARFSGAVAAGLADPARLVGRGMVEHVGS